jgi:hypothetical protein
MRGSSLVVLALLLTGFVVATGRDSEETTKKKAKDVVILSDGKTIRGTLLDIVDATLVLEGEQGKQFIERNTVKRIKRDLPPGFAEFFEGRKGKANSLEAWKKLGKFCKDKGAHPELRDCMRSALLFDSEDQQARGVLGHLFFENRWLVEREVAERLKNGHRIVDGGLVPPAGTTVVVEKEKKKLPPTSKGKTSKGKKEKRERRDIKAVNHLEKVLDEKSAHSLWMLLTRSGIRFARMADIAGETNLKFCEHLIEKLSSQRGEYKDVMKKFLDSLGVPKDWNKANQERIAKFKKKRRRGIHLESKYYHILSTDSMEITKSVAEKMDLCTQEVYHKIFEFEEKISHKYILIFFKNEQQFMQYGKLAGAAAYFSPQSKELVGYNLRKNPWINMDPYQTLFHEGWHQYFDFYIPNCPRWFDEGLAEVVGGTTITKNRVKHSGFNPMRSKDVMAAERRDTLIPLRELVKMSHQEFMVDPQVSYAQSWSFTYFLTTYTHPNKKIQRRVRNFYRDYFWLLHEGTDPVAAVDIVFKDVKFDTLEKAWLKKIPYQN